MDFRRLVEPAGLLYGTAAQDAVRRGLALPLAGGPAAFSCVDLIEDRTIAVSCRSGMCPQAGRTCWPGLSQSHPLRGCRRGRR